LTNNKYYDKLVTVINIDLYLILFNKKINMKNSNFESQLESGNGNHESPDQYSVEQIRKIVDAKNANITYENRDKFTAKDSFLDLDFKGQPLTPPLAKAISHFRGEDITIRNLDELSNESAKLLSKFNSGITERANIFFKKLKNLTPKAAHTLKQHVDLSICVDGEWLYQDNIESICQKISHTNSPEGQKEKVRNKKIKQITNIIKNEDIDSGKLEEIINILNKQ
jgi:hypothetical protein